MITLIILIGVVAFGVYLMHQSYYYEFGGVITVIVGVFLVIHSLFISMVSYNYNLFEANRNAFEETLSVSRLSGNNYETAAIVKDVAKWNMRLADIKVKNNTIFLDQYIDDRFELLEPIL